MSLMCALWEGNARYALNLIIIVAIISPFHFLCK